MYLPEKKDLEYFELCFKILAYLGGVILFVIKIKNDLSDYKLKKVEVDVKKEEIKAKRFNFLEKLSGDFNKEANKISLQILDDFDILGIHSSDLTKTLRNHDDEWIQKEEELTVRNSFDSLLESCLLILYYYEHGMITKVEISFFTYYIKKVKNNQGVINYINTYYKGRGLERLFDLVS